MFSPISRITESIAVISVTIMLVLNSLPTGHLDNSNGIRLAEAAYLKKDIGRLANSPIYYIAAPALFPHQSPPSHLSPSVGGRPSLGTSVFGGGNGGFGSGSPFAPNLFLNVLRQVHLQKKKRKQQERLEAAASETSAAIVAAPQPTRPTTSNNANSMSTIYRLPIQFLSNAKPIEIMTSK